MNFNIPALNTLFTKPADISQTSDKFNNGISSITKDTKSIDTTFKDGEANDSKIARSVASDGNEDCEMEGIVENNSDSNKEGGDANSSVDEGNINNALQELVTNSIRSVAISNEFPEGKDFLVRSNNPFTNAEITKSKEMIKNVIFDLVDHSNAITKDACYLPPFATAISGSNGRSIVSDNNERTSIRANITDTGASSDDRSNYGRELSYEVFQDSLDMLIRNIDYCMSDHRSSSSITSNSGNSSSSNSSSNRGTINNSNSASLCNVGSGVDRKPVGNATIRNCNNTSHKPNYKVQSRWSRLIDNNREMYIPRLYKKLYAVVPIPDEIMEAQEAQENASKSASSSKIDNGFFSINMKRKNLPHPYTKEIKKLAYMADKHHMCIYTRLWDVSTSSSDINSCSGCNGSGEISSSSSGSSSSSSSSSSDGSIINGDCSEGSSSSRSPSISELSSGNATLPSNFIYKIQVPLGSLQCPPPLDQSDIPLYTVFTRLDLANMINTIVHTECAKEIAIDVEHHSMHSYRGFVSLIQMSTRKSDWIIDPFDIFEELHQLNKITANPYILKVLHGSDSDILWLQRDFSVYVVNMFDTGRAAKMLGVKGGCSLGNILKELAGVSTDKSFQLCDWRIRFKLPLTTKMTKYARTDTHFLLYIYDKLKAFTLHSEDGLERLCRIMHESNKIALKVYADPIFDPYLATRALLSNKKITGVPLKQIASMCGILTWREQLARDLDESRHYILANHSVLRMANRRPTSYASLSNTLRPLPLIVEQNSQELFAQIKEWTEERCMAHKKAIGKLELQDIICEENSYASADCSNLASGKEDSKLFEQRHDSYDSASENHMKDCSAIPNLSRNVICDKANIWGDIETSDNINKYIDIYAKLETPVVVLGDKLDEKGAIRRKGKSLEASIFSDYEDTSEASGSVHCNERQATDQAKRLSNLVYSSMDSVYCLQKPLLAKKFDS